MKIIETKLKCAVCGKQSEQKIIESSHTFGAKQHLDTRFDNGVVDKHIQECPYCHYCNFSIDEAETVAKKVVESTSFQTIYQANIDERAKKYICAAMVNEKAKKFVQAGNLYLFATWIFEDNKDLKNATKYRKLAYKNLIKVADKNEDGDLYIECVDLLRKNKEFEKAQELLLKVKTELGNVDDEFKDDEAYLMLNNIINFEEKLINKKDFADHLVEESKVRMSFIDFNCLFLTYSQELSSHSDISIFAPIVYGMKNEYFDAVVKYLKTGKAENLVYGGYSIDKIINAYWGEKLNYIKAVVILDNIEKFSDYGCYIFNPYDVE